MAKRKRKTTAKRKKPAKVPAKYIAMAWRNTSRENLEHQLIYGATADVRKKAAAEIKRRGAVGASKKTRSRSCWI